ncbi:MAG TPA: serine hydrolase domain-containing protein [Caulobacteraceae bacterium]|jgi:CubicO group peptidase (beta-lactamase class C family)|nr:serine hydrolase domain-containing protein [Caulobacteraceae bacterium]
MDQGGWAAPGYEGVRDGFYAGQAEQPGGAQLAVYRHGQKVVDVWAGRDTVNDRPYGEDIITVIMSCSKGATAACMHILAERGLIDYEAPVADYWPEFAAGGKADARIWHLMSHSVGLPGVEPESGVTAHDMLYPERHLGALEAMAPVWTPGASCLYHPITYGSLLNEVVRRVTGKSIARVFAEEIAGPLKLDFWIGLPEAEEPRVAPHFQHGQAMGEAQLIALFSGMGIDIQTRLARVMLNAFKHTAELIETMNNREARAAEVPAGNGIADARSLARMYAALIGEVDGVRLIKPETVEKARTLRTGAMVPPGDFGKLVFGAPTQYGLGYEFAREALPMLGQGSFGHAGAGGRLGFAHPESGTAVGYVANTMLSVPAGPDPRWIGWTKALQDAVGAG